MRERTIASHFVRAALRGAERQGHDCTPLLRQLSIQPALLDEPRARVAPEQFARLVQLLWESLDDEYLGFGRMRSKRGTFAMMCYAIIHCHSLEKALGRGALFYSLFPEAPAISIQREGDWARLSVDDSTLWDPDHFLVESLLVIWHRLGSWLIGQRIRLEEATFTYSQPAHAGEYELLFPCTRRFTAGRTSLLFHARYLTMPLLQAERTDCSNWPDLDAVAQQLHMSPQTLRRHLREEGSSFQELKDHLRRDLAIYHLGRDELAIQDIAEQLGFSEPSAFHRAFKKWTGLTPGAYRAQEG